MIPPAAIAFLAGLSANNSREWFEAHRAEYIAAIREPLRNLLAALAPAMLTIDPLFDADPRYGAVSRIHRDTRFSRDKSPYRTVQWIAFKRRCKDWQSRPAFFVEFGLDGWRRGLGFYAAETASRRAQHERVLAAPDRLAAAAAPALTAGFRFAGEPFRRPRVPEGLPDAAREILGRKSWYLEKTGFHDAVFHGPELAETIAREFQAAAPLYEWLAR